MSSYRQPPAALVTGGARRLGAAIAGALHAKGYSVLVHYRRSSEQARALCTALDAERPGTAQAVAGDLSDPASWSALAETVRACFGGLDCLVNNASSFYPTPVDATTEADWDQLFASNAKAPFFLTQALRPLLARRGGTVINLTDVHAQRPLAGHPVYCAAKAALTMLTKSLAKELGPEIRVNAVAPGTILWPEDADGNALAQPELLERTALKRRGEPGDIAEAVCYLARAGYVTGQVLAVDGGRSLSM